MSDEQNNSNIPKENGHNGDPRRTEPIEGAYIKPTSGFAKWLDNFFYYYKWHTIVALFLVVTITICSVQMCSKTSFDVFLMYAGGAEIEKTAEEGETPDYVKITSALKQYSKDFDGDGEKNVHVLNLFIPSAEEIEEVESNKENGYEINYSLIQQDTESLKHYMVYGEYYICILSEDLFRQYTEDSSINFFAPIAPYTNGNKGDYEYASEYGIYLSSTSLADKPGFSLLCEGGRDSVICIRAFSELAANTSKSKNKEIFKNSEQTLKSLLAAG